MKGRLKMKGFGASNGSGLRIKVSPNYIYFPMSSKVMHFKVLRENSFFTKMTIVSLVNMKL